jgi:hypothetical protein
VIALVCVEAVAIVLLAVLVAGLLRSHAEILRALHGLGVEADWTTRSATAPGVTTDVVLGPSPVASRPAGGDDSGRDIVGTDPTGGAVRIAVTGARHDTLIAFLSTGCSTCRTFWDTFRSSSFGAVPGEARLVVVTRGPEAESPGLVRDIAPQDVPVVLSTDAWAAYDVPVAPYFVLVEGSSGRIVGEGAGTSWAQVASLLAQALGDAPRPRPPRRTPSTDRAREARADEELLSAGIRPGDPRLYPTHLEAAPGQDHPQ